MTTAPVSASTNTELEPSATSPSGDSIPPPATLNTASHNFWDARIGRHLLAAILLFSSVVTLLLTIGQLYFDYQRDVRAIETRLDEIEHSYLDSIAGSLWNVDLEQLRIQLEGIARLPDMQAVEVRERVAGVEEPLRLTVGESQDRLIITTELSINYLDRGEMREIGVLYVEATLSGVYSRLADKAMVILISQGLKTFLVSLFILYIVHRLVTRHLATIARFLGRYDIRRKPEKLVLDRKARPQSDELDQMVMAFNNMCTSLENAYEELNETNKELELDIAARHRAEQEINRLNTILEQRVRQRTAELEAANRELAAFSYSVSHDLRAPLRRIEGFGRILTEGHIDRLDENGLHCVQRIQAGVNHMGEMIDSFLVLARASRSDLTVESIDLTDMACEVVSQLCERDPNRVVEVRVEPGMELEGDVSLIRLAVENLLDNAWKYTAKVEHAEVVVGATRENGRVVFFVSDNGAGFDEAYTERLFVPFSRLHRAEDFDGTGIGLATVQRIVTRHGGRVWGEGKFGTGATFYFTCWDEGGGDE